MKEIFKSIGCVLLGYSVGEIIFKNNLITGTVIFLISALCFGFSYLIDEE